MTNRCDGRIRPSLSGHLQPMAMGSKRPETVIESRENRSESSYVRLTFKFKDSAAGNSRRARHRSPLHCRPLTSLTGPLPPPTQRGRTRCYGRDAPSDPHTTSHTLRRSADAIPRDRGSGIRHARAFSTEICALHQELMEQEI